MFLILTKVGSFFKQRFKKYYFFVKYTWCKPLKPADKFPPMEFVAYFSLFIVLI